MSNTYFGSLRQHHCILSIQDVPRLITGSVLLESRISSCKCTEATDGVYKSSRGFTMCVLVLYSLLNRFNFYVRIGRSLQYCANKGSVATSNISCKDATFNQPQSYSPADEWSESLAGELLSALTWTWDILSDIGYDEFSEFVAENLGINSESFLCSVGTTVDSCSGLDTTADTCVCIRVSLHKEGRLLYQNQDYGPAGRLILNSFVNFHNVRSTETSCLRKKAQCDS